MIDAKVSFMNQLTKRLSNVMTVEQIVVAPEDHRPEGCPIKLTVK